MLKPLSLAVVFVLAFCSVSSAQRLSVVDAAVTTAIEDQMPVDRVESYPADYGKLYCFTRIVGAEEATQIIHVWSYLDQEMARVPLKVGSADWRTFSSKRFLPQWSGEWKVTVLDEEQNIIATIPFLLE